jgi:NAD(P)-dependent dehydrogenase (short-subunit alcohol dehydrogenase family)
VQTGIGVGSGTPSEAGLAKVMAFVQATSSSRIAFPDEIASVIAFLASDEASYMNGAIVAVDNGWLAA